MDSTGCVIRGRFAPTPSGEMHLGNAFSALLAWLSVRSAGGEIILRMEDLDPDRCHPEYADGIRRDLLFLGLDWDGEPYVQSNRLSLYEMRLGQLQQKGRLYPCFCSRNQLHAANAPHTSDGRYLYSGRCRDLNETQRHLLIQSRSPSQRLYLPHQNISFADGLYGPQSFWVDEEFGDIILQRSDGVYAYHLAVVADDIDMGVTQVVRGRDLLPSTACHIALMQLFGATPPQYIHVPLLVAPDGRRLSKRDGDLSLSALRDRFSSPEPIIGRLAAACGLLPRYEPMAARDLISLFSWDKVHVQDLVITPENW